jgi:hypothetical protein
VELEVARKRVCDLLDALRSKIHAREAAAVRDETGVVIAFPKRGPRTEISDERLLELIREVIDEGPFSGEGHRKVTAPSQTQRAALTPVSVLPPSVLHCV